jgi:Flp pilus assembly protein TadG
MTNTHTKRLRLRREDGQAFVEFALVLPILALLLFAILQAGVAFHDYISYTDAVRVGARAAAVDRDNACDTAKDAIQGTLSTRQWTKISTPTCNSTGDSGDPFTVSLVYKFELPYLKISKDLTVSATERLE